MTAPPDDGPTWGRLDKLLLAGIGLRTLYGLAMLPLIPLLIATRPLLLTLLSGSTVAEVALGVEVRTGDVPWLLAVAAAVPLWLATDWLYWLAGRRWGDRALERLSRGNDARSAQRIDRTHRAMQRLGPVGVVLAKAIPVPPQLIYAVAGAGGMRLGVFLALNLLGVTLAAAVVITLGYAVGEQAVALIDVFQRYAALTTGVVVALLLVVWLVRRRRAGLSAPSPE
ncbi:VTT domain-containing protein [uncultured Nocardioides sp.]|uniref:DedA family protein n=1 Tax=uncultured Nocardioides sp. TaxID=198441 RepID=UPI0026116303|nr:VTT domain-containing protein [uncultured Nocardioides sp.]